MRRRYSIACRSVEDMWTWLCSHEKLDVPTEPTRTLSDEEIDVMDASRPRTLADATLLLSCSALPFLGGVVLS